MKPRQCKPAIKNNYFTVQIPKTEYILCERISQNMWANSKRGFYGRGIINSKNDPTKAERIGKLGETAFAKIFNLAVDDKYKHGGDNFDFILNDKTIDVKTSYRKPSYDSGLIYAENHGKDVKLKSDIYVFAFLEKEDLENKKASVVFVGWEYKDNIILREKVNARVGFHKNYEIPFSELKLMRDLNER